MTISEEIRLHENDKCNQNIEQSLILKSKVPYIYLVNEIYERFKLVPVKIVSKLNDNEEKYISDFVFMTEFSLGCILDWPMYLDEYFFDAGKDLCGYTICVGRELHTYKIHEKVWYDLKQEYKWNLIESKILRNNILSYSTLILKNAMQEGTLSTPYPEHSYIKYGPDIDEVILYPGMTSHPYNIKGSNPNFTLLINSYYDGNNTFIYDKDIMNFTLDILEKYETLKDKNIEYTLKRTI